VHIDYRKAPLVIQRFGDVKKLVEQTLDPMVSAYFKNIGQTRTLIQLIQDRSAIQDQSGVQMKEKFVQYNLELQEVLIGTPTSGAPGGQIEQIQGQMKYIDETTSTAAINVTLIAEETIKPITIGGWKPQGVARDAAQALVKFLQGFVNFIIYLILLVLPILIVVFGPIALIIWGILALVKRRRAKKNAQAK